jgi:2-keto-4-pentenoate hydratase/2-oxohepta-3-ene-1,7-dioic acid hydratase in catechol pathway
MKLVTFRIGDGSTHIGSVLEGGLHISDFTAADPACFASMLALIDGGSTSLAKARELDRTPVKRCNAAEVVLLAPIEQPRRLRDFLCFEQHFRQSRANRYLFGAGTSRLDPATVDIPAVWYDRPVYYKGNCYSVVGPEAKIFWPSDSRVIDFELEIGLVTSRIGKNIEESAADSYVFGYTIFNDFSARDLQYEEMSGSLGPAKGKDFDSGNAIGPWLVTPDEVGDPQNLQMAVRVNGEEWARGTTANMHHTFHRMISYASANETLQPGELLGSGTVGNGSGNERGQFLKHGDVLELEVEKLGVLRNVIEAPHVMKPPTFPIKLFARPTA